MLALEIESWTLRPDGKRESPALRELALETKQVILSDEASHRHEVLLDVKESLVLSPGPFIVQKRSLR